MDSIVVVITRAPYGREDSFSGLYVPIVTIAEQIRTQVLLIEDGVFSALKGQKSKDIRYPSTSELVSNIVTLDGKVYADVRSCEGRGIKLEELIEGVQLISDEKIAQMLVKAKGTIVI
jgi:sulfur relay (sulfurtransferase) DsrF/TusC family protein